jgi:sigma-B regulation protein RsbU (phosphoserine phosphatase)
MEKILVTLTERETLTYEPLLKEAGYLVLRSQDIAAGLAQLNNGTSLWLLSAELLLEESCEVLARVEEGCREHEVFCLLLAANGKRITELQVLVPWAAVLELQASAEQILLNRVRDQLTIRRLVYERDLAQAHLMEKQQEYRSNLESAALIQRSLLPQTLPEVASLEFAARFVPSERVGGDLYNALQISEDTVMFYLLDVSGHGISSAMVTVSLYQSLSLQTGQIVKQRCAVPPYYRIPSPAEVLTFLDREFPFDRFEKFFTINYLLLNVRSGRMRYSSAGHPAPLLVRADGSWRLLDAGGPIVGVDGITPFDEGEVQLLAGDRIYLYSDGITEHMSDNNELFGVERMIRRLVGQRRRSLDESCSKLLTTLHDYSRVPTFRDDVTLFACEYRGPG